MEPTWTTQTTEQLLTDGGRVFPYLFLTSSSPLLTVVCTPHSPPPPQTHSTARTPLAHRPTREPRRRLLYPPRIAIPGPDGHAKSDLGAPNYSTSGHLVRRLSEGRYFLDGLQLLGRRSPRQLAVASVRERAIAGRVGGIRKAGTAWMSEEQWWVVVAAAVTPFLHIGAAAM